MNQKHISIISGLTGISEKQVENTVKLLETGATIPFISRYRKEATGSLDEVDIEKIKDNFERLAELEKRKETILKSIAEQDKLSPELEARIKNCYNSVELEDIYLPFKQKRKTKATVARDKGLEPLAKIIMAQNEHHIEEVAKRFITKDVKDIEEALEGARDIIAEWLNENLNVRNAVRRNFERDALIRSKLVKGKELEGQKFKDYFAFEEPLKRCPSHRYMAIHRGENEGFLKYTIAPDEEKVIEVIEKLIVRCFNSCAKQLNIAIKDAYKRLLQPSIETEFRNNIKEKSDLEAIKVFAENLRQLLLAPPLGQKRILGIDPGFKSGCKVVCLNEYGDLVYNENIYPHPPQSESALAAKKILSLVNAYKIQAIAIGNGTAGRETEFFIRKIKFDSDVQVFVVSEQGASIYSASSIAREEFPEYDVTVRGTVSIARRLADPMAELVKIDPKSIGVGQYQHDVNQTLLKKSLDAVVESSVNNVGVNLNTASKYLLTYISGLGPQLAQNIVDYRTANGLFTDRSQIKKVARMGDKAFEQCAGFLRIQDGDNPLDNSAVHPETYPIVKKMAKDLGATLSELMQSKELREKINIQNYITPTVGLPTLKDIMAELEKPSRDPRNNVKVFEFDKNVRKVEDLEIGMVLPGIVSNITNFGAFVDIGVKQDGLVHISNLANEFISNPADFVKLHQHVMVKVIEVDAVRKRIQLSMKDVE